MADIPSAVSLYEWFAADPAANTGSAAALPPAGAPDTADISAYYMPKAGAIVCLIAQSAPSSGDTVVVQLFKNGNAMTGITVTCTNAAPNASAIFLKDLAAAQFVAGDLISARYTTTTGTVYTVHDVVVDAIVQWGLSE